MQEQSDFWPASSLLIPVRNRIKIRERNQSWSSKGPIDLLVAIFFLSDVPPLQARSCRPRAKQAPPPKRRRLPSLQDRMARRSCKNVFATGTQASISAMWRFRWAVSERA